VSIHPWQPFSPHDGDIGSLEPEAAGTLRLYRMDVAGLERACSEKLRRPDESF